MPAFLGAAVRLSGVLLLRDSASKASYHGEMILGEDLMRIQVTPRGPQQLRA